MQLNLNNIHSNFVGAENGLSQSELAGLIKAHQFIITEINNERKSGKLPFLDLPTQNIDVIEKFARLNRGHWQDVVILGIGGSALGMRTLANALLSPFYNLLNPAQRKYYPRLFVLDNVDPDETAALFNLINPKKTLFIIISKSGQTIETLASFLKSLEILKKSLKQLVIITDRQKGILRQFVQENNIASFETPAGVAGRYSVLSAVGLVPAALVGINIRKLLHGASRMDELCKSKDNPAYRAALVNWALDTKKDKNIIVLMPYAAGLKDFAEWFRQLWAESLGKRYNQDGQEVFTGPTPIKALGVTDQHSQIQLYNEGPNNKLIIFIEVARFRRTVKIPRDPGLRHGWPAGLSLNDLMSAEKKGTETALTQNHRPNYTIKLPDISEETIGGLLYFWELATTYAGKLYNVNVFNQPGVEAGKKITTRLLLKKGKIIC